jgi:hypothetical protein
MIWLSWRQFRFQAIISGCLLAAILVVLLISGLSLAHLYDESGLAKCGPVQNCQQALQMFRLRILGGIYKPVFNASVVLTYAAPALIGIFWGAPLVAREFEAGTFRLAWTQSISRKRWLVVKVALIGVLAMVVAGLLSLVLSWWIGPVYKVARIAAPQGALSLSRMSPLLFGVNGIAPIGYAAFAFALGLTAGVLLRRTVPAMAVTLGGFAVVQVAWPFLIRPHLIAPVRSLMPLRAVNIAGLTITNNNQLSIVAAVNKPAAWVLSDQAVNSAGHAFTGSAPAVCTNGGFQACNAAIAALHLRQLVVYEPASRYWPLQGVETVIFLVVAVALALFCSVRISRRRLA